MTLTRAAVHVVRRSACLSVRMARRAITPRCLTVVSICILATFTIAAIISMYTPEFGNVENLPDLPEIRALKVGRQPNLYRENLKLSTDTRHDSNKQKPENHLVESNKLLYGKNDGHKLAVIIPYRDRFEELLIFAPYIQKYLTDKQIPHKIYVVHQVDNWRFNRAALINIGFLLSESECDYIVMHDVDLLPLNHALPYNYPQDGPMHVAAPTLHPIYHYQKYIGGILLIARHHFRLVNGMSNRFWGWGREDDELYVRIINAGLMVNRPVGITTGTNDTFKHIHDKGKHKRDMKHSKNQKQASRKRDRFTGLDNVRYSLDTQQRVTIEDAELEFINIRLHCNVTDTPWCIKPENIANGKTTPNNVYNINVGKTKPNFIDDGGKFNVIANNNLHPVPDSIPNSKRGQVR